MQGCYHPLLPLLLALVVGCSGSEVRSQSILRVAEMTAPEIAALDRDRTVVLLPGGILEQHGPYLPSFSDGYWNERLTEALADSIAARGEWTVVIFPLIPLGNSGANDIGGRFSFPGTYTVRFETLRNIFMDLATELGEQGFRRIFVVHSHGAPNHSRALEQAGDYFHDAYGGFMVHLGGLLPVIAAWEGDKDDGARDEDGLAIHAGMDETSWVLHLRPDLVRPGYRGAEPLAGSDMDELITIAERPNWPGYLGSPRLANAPHGASIWEEALNVAVGIATAILDGKSPGEIPRFADEMLQSPPDVRLDQASLEHEERIRQQQDDWLRSRGLR
jgi:creatinine amidohydrolase/Fe(II)-dependent formamide hydrolase-like protein